MVTLRCNSGESLLKTSCEQTACSSRFRWCETPFGSELLPGRFDFQVALAVHP